MISQTVPIGFRSRLTKETILKPYENDVLLRCVVELNANMGVKFSLLKIVLTHSVGYDRYMSRGKLKSRLFYSVGTFPVYFYVLILL